MQGLSESEVIARRERGQGNVVQFQTGRSYLQILRKNAFTFINTVLFAIGIVRDFYIDYRTLSAKRGIWNITGMAR